MVNKTLYNLDAIEDGVFDSKVTVSHDVVTLRRDIASQRRIIGLLRGVVADLERKAQRYTEVDLKVYFGDINDHIARLWSNLDECQETIEIYKDTDFLMSQERTNRILAVLTIIFTISIPFTVVGSLYGMNVHLPGGTETGAVAAVEDYLRQGYRRVKIKIKPGRDIQESQAVRQAFPDLRLQVDANSAYTLTNCSNLKPLDNLNLLLIEQPLAEVDLWDHSRMQSQFNTPICLDESILSPRHARQALEMKACRVINIKAGRVGGLGQAVEIHDLCRSQGVPVWCGGMLETGVGRAAHLALASLPGFILPGDISASDR